jgi:hypothetical protein
MIEYSNIFLRLNFNSLAEVRFLSRPRKKVRTRVFENRDTYIGPTIDIVYYYIYIYILGLVAIKIYLID